MAKVKSAYVCSECGAEHAKWIGQCDACGAWNTLKEFKLGPAKNASAERGGRFVGYAGDVSAVRRLDEIDLQELPRVSTNIAEFDRVLGGGMVAGSVVLIGGHPGAGKSTLLLQVMCRLAQQMDVLYVTGEESLQQVAMRAHRLQLPTEGMKLLAETDVEIIVNQAREHKPKILATGGSAVGPRRRCAGA